jgi:oxygen-independent coproporphyrinogen III oxidase
VDLLPISLVSCSHHRRIMCDLAVDLHRLSRFHGRDLRAAIVDRPRIKSLIVDGAVTVIDDRPSISDSADFLVRSVAAAFDAHLAYSAAMNGRAV